MIAVDTSVWVAALRDAGCTEAVELRRILDADEVCLPVPVRIEILSGARRRDRLRLGRLLSALPVLYPQRSTWQRIEGWIERASRRGERFGFADLLIGALAADRDAPVWSIDQDFNRMSRIGVIDLHQVG